jgi:hypothetical protein
MTLPWMIGFRSFQVIFPWLERVTSR